MENRKMKIFLNGLFRENPLFVMMLGVCPALAMTSKASSALTMGIVTAIVLVATNIISSALKRMIPDSIHIPCEMMVIAGLVCCTEYILSAYFPNAYAVLGVYTSLVAVNCLILGRAEVFARRNSIANSAVDGLGMGTGYTLALVILGIFRELLGNGTIFGATVTLGHIKQMEVASLAPGAFILLGFAAAIMNKLLKGRNMDKYRNKCEGCPSAQFCHESKLNKRGGTK